MYGLLTYITERIGGRSWEELMRTELFQPLGMTSSDFLTTVDVTQVDLAQGYGTDRDNGDVVIEKFGLNRYIMIMGPVAKCIESKRIV
jgi:CubicO group peptidase (beta-lactamase class C family)